VGAFGPLPFIMWLKDPKTGQESVTVTAFMGGLAVALLKLLSSGLKIGDFQLETFSGGEFAAVVGALGAIYAMRKATDKEKADG
jgi:hypothetical protein